jgi:hypothetical protein
MKKYLVANICEGVESGIYLRDDSYYACVNLRNSQCEGDISVITDATLKITITNPCGTTLVDAQDMTHSATLDGTYVYCYELSSTTLYGEYEVEIEVSSPSDCATRVHDNFFVLPWDMTKHIRRLLGSDAKTIDDHELAEQAWYAYVEVRDKAMELQYREKLCCCVDGICSCCGNIECDCICGTSSPTTCSRWKLKHYPIADFNNDDNIHGCECDDASEDCQNDICIIWKDSNGECQSGAVKVKSAECGEIEVLQSDCSTAIPSTNEGIFATYRSTWKTFTMSKFKKAVAYLAAYELAVRFNLVSKTVPGCNEHAKVEFTKMLWNRYQVVLDSIIRPAFGGID